MYTIEKFRWAGHASRWIEINRTRRRVTAERILQRVRNDNPASLFRIHQSLPPAKNWFE